MFDVNETLSRRDGQKLHLSFNERLKVEYKTNTTSTVYFKMNELEEAKQYAIKKNGKLYHQVQDLKTSSFELAFRNVEQLSLH